MRRRLAAREAAWQAELEAQVEDSRKKVAAAKRLHAAQVRRQKELLRSIGVPDVSPEEIAARVRRRPSASAPAPVQREAPEPLTQRSCNDLDKGVRST
jgi:hypothetical protein